MLLEKISSSLKTFKKRRHLKDYFKITPAGTITGAADNDPSGIATYTQVGALTKFSQLWLMLLTIPMLVEVEEMSARIGVVAKKGLARVIKDNYGFRAALLVSLVLLVCNITTLGADIAGMAAALGLLTKIPWYWFIIPIALILGFLLIKENFKFVNRFLFILTPFLFLYVITAFIVDPPWREVIRATFIPQIKLSVPYLMAAVALLGTTISPYLIFWQTTEEIEEKKAVKDLKEENAGVISGMIYANLIFYFVVLCAGAVLFSQFEEGGIKTAADAALALKPLAGDLAWLLFALGILFSGLIAVPVLAASSAYALAEVLGFKEGLDKTLSQAQSFNIIMILSLVVGAGLVLLGLSPIQMLFYSQVLQGILTPILIIFLLKICNSKNIMGQHTNTRWDNFVGWGTAALMAGFSILMFWQIIIK